MSETNTRVKREDDSMGGERAAWHDIAPGAWDRKRHFFGHGVEYMVWLLMSLFVLDSGT
jgi:hypothetical protein